MRIVGGELGGRVLRVPKDAEMRPTSERVREAVFSSLASMLDFSGAAVLDLYAGSGSLGIEALSRGAESAVFVELSGRHARVLEKNLTILGLAGRSRIVTGDVFKVVEQLSGPFGLAFADPPYAEHPGLEVAELLLRRSLLAPGAVLVVESAARDVLKPSDETKTKADRQLLAVPIKDKIYGDTRISYFSIQTVSENNSV